MVTGQIDTCITNKAGCCCSFLIETFEILKMKKVFSLRKLLRLTGEVNFGSERMVLDIKFIFLQLT